ncbi:MAG: hypothetical protein CM1200mP8_6340 [Chloroflexota bacterium]|nr:MAG: hypothetical protein CM1200mP8_6340 [Chloroflexota bacterium]
MNTQSTDVVIVGGGIVGVATAYLLGKAGINSVIIEKDSVGSHASGFAYGRLGRGVQPGPHTEFNRRDGKSTMSSHVFCRGKQESIFSSAIAHR